MNLPIIYEDDLPSPGCITSELHCWQMKWKQHLHEHALAEKFTINSYSYFYTFNLYVPKFESITDYIMYSPSCSAERCFNGLKRIKSILRSSMTTERLSRLSLLHLHHDIPIDIEAAIDEFCHRHPWRLKMANTLSD